MLAELDPGALIGIGTAVGGIITAMGAALINFLRAKGEERRKDQQLKAEQGSATHRTTVDEYRLIVTDLKEQCERYWAVVEQHQHAIGSLQEENADCREENAGLRATTKFLYERYAGHHSAITSMGGDPGPLMPIPKVYRSRRKPSSEFQVRQALNSAELVREADKTIPRADKPPEDAGEAK